MRVTCCVCVLMCGLMALSSGVIAAETSSPIAIGADLRLRHDMVDTENADVRNRQRIRARISLSGDVNNEVSLGFRFASGSDDPVSTNQTLDGGFSSKQVNIDLAYVVWKPSVMSGLSFVGGKVKNPFRSPGKTELLWDGDLNPEGFAVSVSRSLLEGLDYYINASYFSIDERKSDNDAALLGVQAGTALSSDMVDIMIGAGYFDYQNTKSNLPVFDGTDSFGNSTDANGNYLYDYNEVELLFELAPKGMLENAAIFVDLVTNIAPDVDDNMGWLAGAKYGVGPLSAAYSYRYLEKDAVLAAFTDSDFIGGGSDGIGHEVSVKYNVAANVQAGISYFMNQTGVDNGKEYHRVLADIVFKY